MKRIVGLLFLIGIMAVPGVASAAGQVGVYVAPKFIAGATQTDNTKMHATDSASGESASISIGNKVDSTFGGAIAVGYDFDTKFNLPVRAELEYAGFHKSEAKRNFDGLLTLKQTFGIQTLFVNAYWDINLGTKFTPYLGGGLGLGFIRTKGEARGDDDFGPWSESTGSKSVTNFAWNAGAGLSYDFTDNWTMDVGYRFVGLGSVKTKTYSIDEESIYGKTDNLYQHQLAFGIRYTF